MLLVDNKVSMFKELSMRDTMFILSPFLSRPGSGRKLLERIEPYLLAMEPTKEIVKLCNVYVGAKSGSFEFMRIMLTKAALASC